MRDDEVRPDAAAEQLADAGRMRLLSHDLRAAVSDIIGGLRLIDQDGLDSGMRLQLERVRASGETLARLLEEGLSIMLGEEDLPAAQSANLQMARFLYDVEMRWSGRASEKGLTFRLTRCKDVPEVLTLDRIALERVLANTLSNAMKHADSGTVALDVYMSPEGSIMIAVTDEGPGFSADALTRLFEYQGRPEGTTKPGQGLGMHISKHMASRLGGTISVENLPRRGARVTLELPTGCWAVAEPDRVVELPDLSRTKVLIAEDNATNQTIIGNMLTKMGAEFEIAEDGIEALHWLEREDFDLALIDIEMPRLNGIEVIRELRGNNRMHSHMPIIAITAYVLRANRDAIYAAGANAILAKPLAGIESFGLAIANVLDPRAAGIEEDDPAQIATQEFDRECFDRLIDIAGPAAAAELLMRLHTDLRRTERGLVAGLAEGNADAIRADTHVLIALAGAVGAARLQTLAQTLNAAAHRRNLGDMPAIGAEALEQLDRLIHFIAQEQTRRDDAG